MEPLVPELEQLRQAICQNTQLIDHLPLLRAIKLIQEAHLAHQAPRRTRRTRPPVPPSASSASLVAALMLLLPPCHLLLYAV